MSEERKTHTPPDDGLEEGQTVDPQRTALPLEVRGAGASNRIVWSNTGTEAEDFTEGDDVRDAMDGFLEQKEIRRGPIDIKKFVGRHFKAAKALSTVKEGDKPFPSVEDVVISLADLGPEELADINQMQKPVLQLLPVTSSHQVLRDLNGNKPMDGQVDAVVSPVTKRAFESADARDGVTGGVETIVGWNVAITEGADVPGVLKGDNVDENLEDRLAWFSSVHGNRGIDLKRYIKLQQAGFAKKPARPVDDLWGQDDVWTMLNGEPIRNGCVIGGDWISGRAPRASHVLLNDYRVDYRDDRARFRLSVMRRCA